MLSYEEFADAVVGELGVQCDDGMVFLYPCRKDRVAILYDGYEGEVDVGVSFKTMKAAYREYKKHMNH